MKIKKMKATFGCLSSAEMTFGDGLNIICAPNESGKSTWCAFIRAMLYGVDSTDRAKGGYLPDKTRFAPWSGAPMSGSMDIEYGGRDVTLRRSTRTASAPMREFAAVYTGTEEPAFGLTGTDAGETLTGVSREVFRRSAFIGQGDVAVTAAADLEKRIASVVTSGEEGISYTEADNRLRAWLRRRQFNKRGAIPELDAEIETKAALLEKLSLAASESGRLSEDLEQSKKECAELKDRLTASRGEQRSEALDRLGAAKEREIELTAANRAAMEASVMKKAELESGMFGTMTPDEAAETAGADAEKAASLLKISCKKVPILPAAVLTILCLASLAAGIILKWQFYIAAGIFAAAALVFWSLISTFKKNALACTAAREKIIKKYAVQNEDGIYAAADSHSRRWEEYQRAKRAEEKAAAALQALREETDSAQSSLISGGDSDKTSRLLSELTSCTSRETELRAKLSELTGSLRTLGDPMAIESGLLELKERRARLEEQYGALALAVETLKDADTEMQNRFSPALGRTAAKYLSRLTGGRYDELTLSRDFTAMARLTGDTVPHETAYLSAGAADLMYLAVRLAVCELALPEDDPCPLVLDDALVNFDSERKDRAMGLLGELAEKRQIILFTCE